MAKHFSPEEEDLVPEQKREQKSSQRLLLLLLGLLVLVFAYLYFFTGMIRPRPQAPPAPKAGAEGPLVKKPLPPRVSEQGGQAAPEAKPGGGAEKAAQPAGAPQAAQGEKGAPAGEEAKAGKPAAQQKAPHAVPEHKAAPSAKPAAAEGKGTKQGAEAKGGKAAPQAEGKAANAGEPEKGKGAPAGKAKGAEAVKGKPAQAEKTASAEKGKAAPAAPAGKKAAKAEEAAAAKEAAKAKPAPGAYALELKGEFAESEIGPVTSKLKQAGISHLVKTKSHRNEQMHRLYLADFADRNEAVEELERLKLAAPEAFMLKENGRYAIYAGSYMRQAKAAAEQRRLYEKGVQLLIKPATVPVSVVKLRAGSFADKASAAKAAVRVKKAGIDATAVKVGK